MGVSMAAFTTFIEQFSDVLWNSLLLFLLVGTGVYFTVRLRGVQVRRFGEGFRRVFGGFTLRGKKADAEGMSSFQALTTAIAAQVGTGNITGCATALVSGGPGALFWTWVSAFFGMATIYAEAVLAQHYKTTVNGQVTGGPAYYTAPRSRARSARCWPRCSRCSSFWRWASWATWCSPTPSVMRSTTPLA